MTSNRIQIIERDGRPEYAVVPYKDYERLVVDAEVVVLRRQARGVDAVG